ncbi:MAG: MBL fold metallo-hydrolase [Thermoanaerobaculia bacterium]|nr:MBL fold metallo-hydrolase [Thermoanaerobaculia bacterium]
MDLIEHQGVEGLRVGRFPGRINTTCILYRLGETVIDTGPANQWSTVKRFLRERSAERILVTHHHEDHGGNLARVVRATGGTSYSPRASRRPLAEGFPLHLYRRIVWGRPETVEPTTIPPRIPAGGSSSLTPIAAPGHSADMTCYLEPDRGWLFSGDLYVSSRIRYLRRDEDLPRQLETLRSVLELDFETVFCSHRGVLSEGREALARKLDFLESLVERVQNLRRRGMSPGAITRELLGREDLMSWITAFHYSKRNLVEGCLAVLGEESRPPGEGDPSRVD